MLACIGDIHLDAFVNNPEIEGYILETLELAINKALNAGATAFVLMGDVFNTANPTQASVVAFLQVLNKFQDHKFYIILGNHDYSSVEKHSLQIAKYWGNNIKVIDSPKVLKVDSTKVFLCPHPFVEQSPKSVHWSLGHFAVSGARSDNGFVIKAKNQPKGKWILGDFHTPQSGRVNSCKYHYVGSLTQMSWQEKPQKRIILLDGKDHTSLRITPTYELIEHRVKHIEDLEGLRCDRVYYRLILEGNVTLPVGYLSKNKHIVRVVQPKTRQDKKAQVLVGGTKIDPLERLPEFLRQHHSKVAEEAIKLIPLL